MAKKRTTKKSAPGMTPTASAVEAPSTAAASEAAPTATLVSAVPASASPPGDAVVATEAPAQASLALDAAAPASTEAPPSLGSDEAAPASVSGEAPVSLSPVSKKKKKGTKKKRADGERISALPATVREGKAGAPSEPPPKVDAAALDAKLEKLEAKLGEKQDAHKAAREGFASDPGADDISVPPVVDLDEHDHFFAAGENAHQRQSHSGASGSFAALDPRHAQKMTPAAHARRAHLSRYVKAIAGLAAALLALGLIFNATRRKPADEPVKVAVVQHTPDIVPQPTQTAAPTSDPPPAATASAVPEPSASAAESAAPVDTAPPVASDTAPAATATAVAPAKTAAQEKATAKAALEKGAFGMAVAAGERAVALDSGDGESWLLLGAAYDSLGNKTQAQRCYSACVAKGKRGPIDECRELIRH